MKTSYIKNYVRPLSLKIFAMLTIISIALTACSKDNNNDDIETSVGIMAKLTDGVWFLESQSLTSTDQCSKNITYQFNKDKTLEVSVYFEDGLGVCKFVHVSHFTFEFDSGTKKLTTTQVPNGTPRDYIILELTTDKLVMKDDTYISSGEANVTTFDRTDG